MRLFFCGMLLLAGGVAWGQQQKWKQWEIKGDTLLNRQDFQGALKYYNKIIGSSRTEEKSRLAVIYKRAVCFYSLGDFQNSLKDLNTFIPAFPDVFNAYVLRAFVYKELGDADHQLLDLNEAIRLNPNAPELLKWRAMVYLDKNEYAKASDDLRVAQKFQDDAETETYLGFALLNIDQTDSAMMALNKAIELDATYLPPYFYASMFFLQNDEYELALRYLNLALRIEPKNVDALFYKGVALVELKKLDEGCSCLNKAFYLGSDGAGDYLKEYCYSVEN